MEYMQSPVNIKEKICKSDFQDKMEGLSHFNSIKIDVDLDRDYDGFELESYVDVDKFEIMGKKKNSFTQKIENITEFCLSGRSEIFIDN